MITRKERLSVLKTEWEDCNRCELGKTRNQVVWYRGSVKSNLMGLGEAPGGDEDEVGKPFVGRCGQELDLLFKAAGVPVFSVFLINRLGCRPPKNRKPTMPELAACRGRMKRMIQIVKPKALILFGQTAAQLAGCRRAITRNRGVVEEVEMKFGSTVRTYPAVITFHPSYYLRKGKDRTIRKQMISDIKLAWGLAHPDED